MPKLDKRSAVALPGPEAGKFDVIHWDDALPGFGLRVLASGARSWVARYRVGKRQRVVTLAKAAALPADKARQKAGEVLAKAKLGRDTRVEISEARAQASETFRALAEDYIRRHVEPKRRASYAKDVRRYLLAEAEPLHGLPVKAISRQRVARLLLNDVGRNAPVGANRTRAALSACFAWAMQQGLAEANPVVGTGKPGKEKPRERVLSLDELRAIWNATAGRGITTRSCGS